MPISSKLIKATNCVILSNFKTPELARNEVTNLRENIIDFRVTIKTWMSVTCLPAFPSYSGLILNRSSSISSSSSFSEEESNRAGFFCRPSW